VKSPLQLPNFRWLWLGQTFILCASQFWFVALVKTRSRPVASPVVSSSATSLSGEIMAGLRYAWKQPAIRISLQMIAMINFAVLGPIVIGVAELVTVSFV
jgi:hypothetical protein